MANFGDPSTWEMNVDQFIDSGLPKEKPQELLDLQEQNRKQRLLQSLQKIGPRLEDSSLDFIRRENFNIGSDPREDFTKFRTLDEEIETLGKKQGEKFLRYLGIYGDASFYQPELSITEKNTAKDFKGKKQLSEWWKTIPNQKRRNVRQSFKDYENFVGTKPAIRRKLYESLRTDKKFYNEFKKQAAKTSITEIADGGSRTSFNKIKNEFDDIVFKKQKQGSPPTKQVTDDGNKILKELKKNTKDSLAKIINKTKIPIERVNSALGALYRNNKDNDGKFRFGKISSKIQEKLNSLSSISVSNIKSELVKKGQATKEEVQQLIGRPSAVLSKILPKGSVFEHTLPKNVTDKLLENNLIDKKTYDTLYRTGSRTSPFLNDFKAKFDIQQGRLLDKYLQDKDYKSYKKEINKIKKTISDKTGGYKIGYVDFKDGKMNIVANAKPLGESLKKFGPETTQKYLALDNIKYTNNLLQNYNNNPNDEAFSSMFNKRTNITPGEKISKEIVEDYKFLEKSYNSAKPFLKSTAKIINFAKKNLNNPVTKALFANPFGKAAGIATTALVVPSALLADESRDDEVLPFINKNEELETQDETSLAGDIGAAAGLTTGASIASKATKADPLKGVRRFGKQGAKNLLKGIFKVAGSPTAAAGFAGSEILDYKKPEDSIFDIDRLDPRNYEIQEDPNIKLAGASLLAPELVGSLAPAGKGILSRAGSIFMNPFGKAARAFTPVGLATIAGGAGYDVYKEIKRRQELTDEERLQEDIEAQAKDDEMMVGAAEGGRIGYGVGGITRVYQLLQGVNKTKPLKGLEEKLIKQYKSEGMEFIKAIEKAQTKAAGIRYESKMKIIDDAMKDTNVYSDDYVDLLDMKIKLEDPDFGKQFKNFPETVKNKTRAQTDEGWAEANFGENYSEQMDIARSKEINESIDPNFKEPLSPSDQMASDIDDMNKANIDDYFGTRKKQASGGLTRIGFADGPDDPSRRKFIKIMGGLASLPIFGKYFKIAEKAAPVVQQLKNTTTNMPEWFPSLVDRFIFKGVGKKVDADVMEYTVKELPDVKLLKQDNGAIRVEGKNAYNEEYYIDYEPPGVELIDEVTGKSIKTKGDFVATDTEYRMISPEDYDIDGVTVNDVDELLGGSSNQLEGFAKGTGKTKYTTGQRRIDEADARGASSKEEYGRTERADVYDPYEGMDPTDFTDD